jgi:tryptophan synthase alpha subunit
VRAETNKPLAVGFGISKGSQAAAVGEFADGVIVGSALVKKRRTIAAGIERACHRNTTRTTIISFDLYWSEQPEIRK